MSKPIEILLVEDDPADVRLTQEVLRESDVRVNLSVAHDGEQAILRLRRQPPYANVSRPDLILLDLNLPRVGGHEVLVAIKSDPALMHIPVVVLSTSDAEEEIQAAYQAHANCYITKPVDLDQFLKIVQTINEFWLTIVTLPPNNDAYTNPT